MLYDNAQLISLYAKAYAHTKNSLYKKTVEETIEFLREELLAPEGAYYSSLDADSFTKEGELEEGAFYAWTTKEIDSLLPKNAALFKEFYNVNAYGSWENNTYVLIRNQSLTAFANKHQLPIEEVTKKLENSLTTLKKARDNRSKPKVDDKILTSWNSLLLLGLTDAYRYLGNENYKNWAITIAEFIEKNMRKADGGLWRNYKDGKSSINGFLDDYATTIQAYLALYEITFDTTWLKRLVNWSCIAIPISLTKKPGCFFIPLQKMRRLLEEP